MSRKILATCALLLAAASCGDDGITDPNPPIITLSAQQAATLVADAEELAAVHPDLEWLADSIEVVVRAGAQAKRIEILENGEPLVFYAVSLQRDLISSTSSFTTWNLFAFDNASEPSVFIVASGFAQGTGTTPPTSMNAGFGGQDAFAHIIVLGDNGAITDRRAITGGAFFAAKSVGGACPVVGTPPANVTWATGDLNGDGAVTAADLDLYCPADLNCSGAVTVQDIFDFLALYFTSSPKADVNGSGDISVQDIFDFLAVYFGGC